VSGKGKFIPMLIYSPLHGRRMEELNYSSTLS